tara:strand:- start:28 stop:1044 length:1017 start_codon:yes stop_codon:yes gene_type:complete
MLERIPEGMRLGPDAYEDPSVTPSFVTAMNQVPQAGAVQQQNVAPVSGGSIPTMENIESMLSGANIDTSIAPNVRDLIRRQRGLPPIATEGGFPPEVNIQAPSIQTAPQLSQAQSGITTTKAPELPKAPKISDSQLTLGQVSPPSMSLEVPQLKLKTKSEPLPSVDIEPSFVADMDAVPEGGAKTTLSKQTDKVFPSFVAGMDAVPKAGAKSDAKDKTVSETKKDQNINKNPDNTSFTSAASNDDIIQKTARKSDIGDVNVQMRMSKILYAKNQAKNAGVDITFKDSDFDKQGFFKPKSKELQKYKAKGISSTGFDPLATKKATGGLIDRRAKKKKKT